MACKGCQTCGFGPRDFAAMCDTCIYGERDDYWATGTIGCTIDGTSIGDRLATMKPCPKGRVASGKVRWLGVEWYGVPYPIRVWLWATHPRHPRPASFVGCGCIRIVKDWWDRTMKAVKGASDAPEHLLH